MDLLKLLFSNSTLIIKDERNGVIKWPRLTPLSADITAASTMTDQPMAATPIQAIGVYENVILNNMQAVKVLMPAALTLHCLITDVSTAESIIQGWKDKESTFTITSRSIISQAMALVKVEFNQSKSNLSAVIATLNFEQTAESNLSNFDPKQVADRDTLGITTKAPESLTTTVSNFYNNVTSKLGF